MIGVMWGVGGGRVIEGDGSNPCLVCSIITIFLTSIM